MHPTTGVVYTAGRVMTLHELGCGWDFTNDDYTDPSSRNGWPFIAKWTKTLEWPKVRG